MSMLIFVQVMPTVSKVIAATIFRRSPPLNGTTQGKNAYNDQRFSFFHVLELKMFKGVLRKTILHRAEHLAK